MSQLFRPHGLDREVAHSTPGAGRERERDDLGRFCVRKLDAESRRGGVPTPRSSEDPDIGDPHNGPGGDPAAEADRPYRFGGVPARWQAELAAAEIDS